MDNFKFRHLTYIFKNSSSGKQLATINDYRPSSLSIECAGLPSLHRAKVKIYYLRQTLMNSLTFLNFKNLDITNLQLDILADQQLIFSGDVVDCEPVFDVPNPFIDVSAMTGLRYLIQPSENINYAVPSGSNSVRVPVRYVVDRILAGSGKSIIYRGVDGLTAGDPRYLGSKLDQLEKLKDDAHLNIVFNHDSVLVASRNIGSYSDRPILFDGSSPKVIRQITLDKYGVIFTTIFDNSLTLLQHVKIINDKLNPNVNGSFIIYELRHELSAYMPDGKFFTEVRGYFREEG